MDGGRHSTSGVGSEQDPSAALDKLFVELHDQLPQDARERFAKLADEMKKLKDAAQTTPPCTPPSSDQELARREEETVEVKQSSRELTKDVVVTSLSDQPTLRDVVCFAVPHIAPKWYDVGIALDVQPLVLDGIEHDQRSTAQPRTMFVKWLQKSPGTGSQARTWKSVLEAIGIICGEGAVAEVCTAVHIQGYTTGDDRKETEPTEHSSSLELQRKRRRSSTKSSEDLDIERQPSVKKQLHEYMQLKMDLMELDVSDLRYESDPTDAVKLLYSNSLTVIKKLLKPHFAAVKMAADQYCQLGLHQGTMGEGVLASAESVDSLLHQMSVTGMWDNTRFLRKAIGSIPRSSPERGVAEAILSHYNLHLAIYERATLLKDALAKRKKSKSEKKRKPLEENAKLVPLKVTAVKAFDNFTCEDCHQLQVQILSTAYGIPKEKITCDDADESHSTTVTFLIPSQYTNVVVQRSIQLETLWALLQLGIIEVSIPGVFTFSPSVACFLTLLRESKAFTADLLRVTEILPYQTFCLIDPHAKKPLSGRPLSTKRIELHWDSQDKSESDPRSLVPESEDKIPAMNPDVAAIPLLGTTVDAPDETHSRVCELEDKVKDLERKVANLFMDNVAFATKLKAKSEMERQQQEEITSLKERLVQALKAQETAAQEQSLSKARELECEDKVQSLVAEKSDLEATVDRLEKKIMQLEEICPSDIERLVKSAMPKQPIGGNKALGQATACPPVVVAAICGQLSTVRQLLDGGAATAEDQDEKGRTALLWASRYGHLPVVRELVDVYKVNVFHKNKYDQNAMHMAAQGGHLEVIKSFVHKFGDRVYERDKDLYSVLHWAAHKGHCEVARYLIEELKMDTLDQDKCGYTALLRAAHHGHAELVRMLLQEFGSTVDEVDQWGFTALLRAAYCGHAEVVKMLLQEFGCSLNEVENRGFTAVMCSAKEGQLDMLRELVEHHGADLYHKSKDGYNALHIAADNGCLEAVKYLIPKFGEKKYDETNNGETCLDLAIQNQMHDVVDWLLQEGGFGTHWQ